MTIKQIKELAKSNNIKARWDSEWREWDIEGYHTDCHEDAARTIECMADAAYGA